MDPDIHGSIHLWVIRALFRLYKTYVALWCYIGIGPLDQHEPVSDDFVGVPYILFTVESSGNGHFKQMSLLLDHPEYCPPGARISVAWDQRQCPAPLFVSDPRITRRLMLGSGELPFSDDGEIYMVKTVSQSLSPRFILRLSSDFRDVLSFIRRERVTTVINLYHQGIGSLSQLVDVRVPVHNIASQYVHFDTPGSLCPDRTLSSFSRFAMCAHNVSATAVSSGGYTTTPITPFASAASLVLRTDVIADPHVSVPSERYVLVYMLHHSQAPYVFSVASQAPDVTFVFFTTYRSPEVPPNVSLQCPDDTRFQTHLRSCSVLWCTGGFMLPCEAVVAGVPMIMSATSGHPEQRLNVQYFQTLGLKTVRIVDFGGDVLQNIRDLLAAVGSK